MFASCVLFFVFSMCSLFDAFGDDCPVLFPVAFVNDFCLFHVAHVLCYTSGGVPFIVVD